MGLGALNIASGGLSIFSAIASANTANEANNLRQQEIREQSVQLRLQENQASLARLATLRKTLAQEEVMFGARGIAPGSATIRAISMENMHEFYKDEDADRLNYASKQLALARQSDISNVQRNASLLNSFTTGAMGVVKTAYNYYQMPSDNLIDASRTPVSAATGREREGAELMDLNA